MGWIGTTDGYAVTLEGSRVVCRNAAGRTLKQLPPKLRGDAEVVRLQQLAEWLERHAREVREQIEAWMVRSLPVPAAVLARVWADEAWREALRDLVVAPVAADGGPDLARAGLLRDADPVLGLGVVDLGGDSLRLTDTTVVIPHPVLLRDPADLEELREFAVELGVRQGVDQLLREVWRRPEPLDAATAAGRSVDTYRGARFAGLRQVTARALAHGYRVRGGHALCPVVEGGRLVEAAIWVGDEYADDEAVLGGLEWRGARGARLTLGEVGPVAWSEGERMAALLYAGREINEDEQAENAEGGH